MGRRPGMRAKKRNTAGTRYWAGGMLSNPSALRMKSGVYGTGERGGERLCVAEVRLRLTVCV